MSNDKRPYVPSELEVAAFPHLSLTCWCFACDNEATEAPPRGDIRILMRRMNLCPDCGNKRCPRSTNHENACTGSNDPGQPGSRYPGGICRYCGRLISAEVAGCIGGHPTDEKGS